MTYEDSTPSSLSTTGKNTCRSEDEKRTRRGGRGDRRTIHQQDWMFHRACEEPSVLLTVVKQTGNFHPHKSENEFVNIVLAKSELGYEMKNAYWLHVDFEKIRFDPDYSTKQQRDAEVLRLSERRHVHDNQRTQEDQQRIRTWLRARRNWEA